MIFFFFAGKKFYTYLNLSCLHYRWSYGVLLYKVFTIHDIMTKCWKDDPNMGPSFEQLRNKLKEMENQHKVEL